VLSHLAGRGCYECVRWSALAARLIPSSSELEHSSAKDKRCAQRSKSILHFPCRAPLERPERSHGISRVLVALLLPLLTDPRNTRVLFLQAPPAAAADHQHSIFHLSLIASFCEELLRPNNTLCFQTNELLWRNFCESPVRG
jgi:hypothetical protein